MGNYIVLGEFSIQRFSGCNFLLLRHFFGHVGFEVRISSLERKSDGQKHQNVVSSMKNVFVEYVFIVFVIFSLRKLHAVAATHYFAANLKELRAHLHACMRFYSKSHRYICMCVRNWKSKNFLH